MPIAETLPPKQSVAKLWTALGQLAPLKESRKRWMRIHPGKVRQSHILHPHPVYSIRLIDLLARHTFAAALRRVGWIYFLQNPKNQLACAEVSIIAGKHVGFRLTEGPFVRAVLRAIQKAQNDPRLRRDSFRLRSIRIESLNVFALWLRANARNELWLPVTPIGNSAAPLQWLTRRDFIDVLAKEAKRVAAARERATEVLKNQTSR
jgi:hypothetical protein